MDIRRWGVLAGLAVSFPLFSGSASAASNFCGKAHLTLADNKLLQLELTVGATTVFISPEGQVSGFPAGNGFQKTTSGDRVTKLRFPTQPREDVTIDYTPYQLRVVVRKPVGGRTTSVHFYYLHPSGSNIRDPKLPIQRLLGSPNDGIIPTARGNRTTMTNGCLVAVWE